MRASNNVCVFHSIYFWSVSGSIWSQPRPGQAWRAQDESHCVVSDSLSLSLSDPIFHHLSCVWWNVRGWDVAVTLWQRYNDSRVRDEERLRPGSGLQVRTNPLSLSCPNCWASVLTAASSNPLVFNLLNSGLRFLTTRRGQPGIMTGLKRLLLIIFSLHNIKHHIIISGESCCYISQTAGGKKEEVSDQSDLKTIWSRELLHPCTGWDQLVCKVEPPTMTMGTIRPFIHEQQCFVSPIFSSNKQFPIILGVGGAPGPAPVTWAVPRAPGQCPQWKHRVEKSTPEPVIVYGPRPPHWPQVGPLGADMSPRPLSVWSSPPSDLWSSSWSPNTIGAFSVWVWRSVHSVQPIVHWVSRAGHIWRHPVQSQRSNISHRQLQQCYVPQAWRYDGRGVEICLRKMRNISLCLCSST